ncbi:hypothetical protein Tco_0339117 [Tanacetum coccineum]
MDDLVLPQNIILHIFPKWTSCGQDGFRVQHLMDILGCVASARRLVSKVASSSIGNSMNTYLQDFQFGVSVPGGCEAVLHYVNRLIESKGNEVGLSILLVDFRNAFNLVDKSVLLEESRAKLLMKTGIDSHGYSFQHVLDVFNTTCKVNVLSITTCTSAPKMMKTLAKCYFGAIEKDLVSKVLVPMLSEGWDHGKDACLDVTGINPFAGMGATSWAPGVALHNAVEKKKRKYASICEENGYKFIPFAFFTFGEFNTEALDTLSQLEKDAVILLKHIRKFSLAQDIRARAAVYIFNRISFAIAKGVGAQIFVLYDVTKPQIPFYSEELDHVEDLLHDQHGGFTLALLDSLFLKGLHTVKSIPPKCHLGFSRVLKGALDKLVRETLAKSSPVMLDVDDNHLDLGERNIKQSNRKICDCHYTAAVRVLSSSNVAPYNDATLEDLKTKHPFKHAPSLPVIPIDHHHLIASLDVVLDRIKSFPQGTSCGRDGLRVQHIMDCLNGDVVALSDELVSSITQVVNLFLDGKCPKMLGEYIVSAPLTPLVKSGGGIRPIAMGTVWRHLVSKVGVVMIGHSLDGLQFGVGVSRGCEAILHAVNRLIEGRGDDVGHSMLLVDF